MSIIHVKRDVITCPRKNGISWECKARSSPGCLAECSSSPSKLLLCMAVSLRMKWNEEILPTFGAITEITCALTYEEYRNVPCPEEMLFCFICFVWPLCQP